MFKRYTVVLESGYTGRVHAESTDEAVSQARIDACICLGLPVALAPDLAVVAAFEGHHINLLEGKKNYER